MTCQQEGCKLEATNIVFWPGKETSQCDEHTNKLKGLAMIMGFQLSFIPIVKKLEFPLVK